ncbi:unnamed protein product [Orchesella dallaii]|uniref:Uncharacterized protein n=1 Tax=Orchesella dallaii TaxID=48710 RepID=A0ABP1PZ82_9HEXA
MTSSLDSAGNLSIDTQPIDLTIQETLNGDSGNITSESNSTLQTARIDPESICYAIINPSGATLEESSSSDGSWMNLEHADCGNLMVAVESEAKDHDVLIRKGEVIARLVFTQIGRPKPLHVNADALQDYLEKLITRRRQLCYIPTLRYGPFSVIPSVILDNNNNDHCTIPSLQDDTISSTPTDLLQSTSGVNNKSSASLTAMSEHSTQTTASAMSNDVKLKGEDKFNVIVAHTLSAMIRTDIGPLKADMDTLKCLVNNAIKILISTPSIGEVEHEDEDDGDTKPPNFKRHTAAEKVKLAPEI